MLIIFRCRKCGRYLYAREGVKTRECYCGHRNNMKKVLAVGKAEDEMQASEMVRKFQGSGTTFHSLG